MNNQKSGLCSELETIKNRKKEGIDIPKEGGAGKNYFDISRVCKVCA